jgi:hypothetical protein
VSTSIVVSVDNFAGFATTRAKKLATIAKVVNFMVLDLFYCSDHPKISIDSEVDREEGYYSPVNYCSGTQFGRSPWMPSKVLCIRFL